MIDSKFKIKIWHTQTNAMYYNVLVGQMEKPLVYIYDNTIGDWIELDPRKCVILQSTRLTDKNGVEIFEGDILKVYDDFFRNGVDDEYGVVKYDDGRFYLNTFRDYFNATWVYFEVVGNIFENKDKFANVVK